MEAAEIYREDEPLPAPSPGKDSRPILLANAREGLDAAYLATRLKDNPRQAILHIARDADRTTFLQSMVQFFAPEIETIVFPAWDCLPYDRVSPHPTITAQRLRSLARLAETSNERPLLVLTTANAVVQRVPPPEIIGSSHQTLEPGQKLDRDALLGYLTSNGYRRVGTVHEPGEFAVRGGLIDIFATGEATPLRLDLFGDEIDTIRAFDPLTQRSLAKIGVTELRPVSEVILQPETVDRFRSGYLKFFGAVTEDPLLEAVTEQRGHPGVEHWLPLFYDDLSTLFDYLPAGCAITLDHLVRDTIQGRLDLIGEHFEARRDPAMITRNFGNAPYRPLPPELLYIDEQSLGRVMADYERFQFSIFSLPPALPQGFGAMEDLKGEPARDFAPERANQAINLFDVVVGHLKGLVESGKHPIIAAHGQGAVERLAQVLADHGLDTTYKLDRFEARAKDGLGLAVLPLPSGFSAPGITILGEQDLFGERYGRTQRRARRADKFLAEVNALSEGDLVVHVEHGIGRFEGLITLEIGGAPHDCLKLLYHNNDRLFVPVENLDVLSRYGNADAEAQLDRLGGIGWQTRKARIKQRIREIAGELIRVAAERAMRKGTPFQIPAGLYDEFVARFPFDETEDQLSTIEAVVDDLTSGRPMDRLVCGDVGFGKTEVALRAAFLAAMSGKQVAFLAPTTLLARQHYHVCVQRFEGMPLRIAQLSRFVTAKDAAAVRSGLADGTIDIVVGTHALLAKGVTFKDIGLVIVDEEQHFGVTHKERLKQLRAEVHVLTMTATPIPRTLHMALGGMRDFSIIATPPVDRLAVRTFILPTDPVILREAIMREYHRGGQIFYVCPRISDQPQLREHLEKLVPEIKISIANGKMAARDLEVVMADFYDRKTHLLLATNIIESGLDIPTANTLIIHRADRFGLSQLYQLRGRVGRSKVRGYAYFTVPSDRRLRETAERRLQVIQSLDGLGAGFQLASHDLDIRGAGNLLGDEQSGQIKEVGFELYNHMLEEAVMELKQAHAGGEAAPSTDWTPQITIDAAALMPESYISDLDLRLAMYRRLASLEGAADIDDFASELIDRFGPMPVETEQLLELVAIKQVCKRANVAKVDAGPKGIVMTLYENRFARPERLVGLIADSKGKLKVRPDHKIVLMKDTDSPRSRLKEARNIVSQLADLAA